ncbi:hypothetical protein D3877_10245 [Azospirillum cavernae]|uniref:Uncharacterized protein n=1 Tax=Azospirillum cavernae TaxID=2320860 RepID=A0A418W4C3_9PROT|nr:hypothetical protein [Azospirillum cavernae]RJF84849.1 hypothetical protein D3877_10245 [Azospirillum cavernae]
MDHTEAVTDGLTIQVELVQYPEALNGPAGHALAARLSEVASAALSIRAPVAAAAFTLLADAEQEVDDLRSLLFTQPPSPAARRYAIRLAAAAIALVAALDASEAERSASPSLESEVTRWLRQTIGELVGRTAAAAILAVTPRMLVSAVLVAPQMDALETGIRLRWGVSLVIASNNSVADVAKAIVAAQKRSAV